MNKYLFLGSITFFTLVYILSYFFIKYYLKKHYTMSYKTGLLFIIMFLLLILSLSFAILIQFFNGLLIYVIFPQIIIAVMFILNEIYHIIIINIFIYLLPSEEIKICSIKLSSLINFITKFARIIPSIIIIILYILFKVEYFENEMIFLNQEKLNYCNIFLFGTQSSIYLICFILSLCFRSYFRNTSKIRIRNKYI